MSPNLKKTCPKCRQTDATEFSTCRFCGTRYDATISKQKSEFDWQFKLKLSVIALLVGLVILFMFRFTSAKTKQLSDLKKSIQAVNKPRVIEFYAPWCGACRAYEPAIEQCQSKYSDRIDFQRLNVDDKNNVRLRTVLWVEALPKTFIFNRNGDQVYEQTGCLDLATLEQHLKDPKLFE